MDFSKSLNPSGEKNEVTKDSEKAEFQPVSQGLIDLKEYAPHILEQANMKLNRSISLGSAFPQGIGSGGNTSTGKDSEVCNDSMRFLNPSFTNQFGTQRLYSNFGFGSGSLLI